MDQFGVGIGSDKRESNISLHLTMDQFGEATGTGPKTITLKLYWY